MNGAKGDTSEILDMPTLVENLEAQIARFYNSPTSFKTAARVFAARRKRSA